MTLLVRPAGSTSASTTNGNLPGGTSITVGINSPANGALLPPGNVTVNGTASVGQGLPVANTALVYVLDVSASTVNSGTGCGGDQNGDGLSNSVLDCEIAAARALNTAAVNNGTVGDVGVVVFGDAGATADVGPAAGDQPLTGPGTDANANGTRDVDEVLRSVHSNGNTGAAGVSLFTAKTPGSPGGSSTNFAAGISAALSAIGASSKPNKLVVYMSDGLANTGGTVASALSGVSGVTFDTFAVGASSSCTSNPSGKGSLHDIASLTGGTCTSVPNVSSLPNIVPGVISAQLTSLQLTVDGGAPSDISSSATPGLPQTGPASVSYSTMTGPLSSGPHTICVTANGSDGGGAGSVQDCHTIRINAPPQANAGGPYAGPEGSAIALSGASASDTDGDSLTYAWSAPAGSGCSFSDATALNPTITCGEEGTYTVQLSVNDGHNPAVTSSAIVNVSDAALTATGACPATSSQSFNGQTATFTDAASPYGTLSDFSATIDWGDGSSSAGTVSGPDGGPYTVSGSHTYASTGYFTIVTTIKDVGGSTASTSCTTLVYAFAPGGGSFVIGDKNAAVGTSATFWGAQWWKLNSLSGGAAPASFKGFAESPTTPACGTSWSTDPGNSAPPPAGPLPAYMGVIVSSQVTKSGSTISGNIPHIVVVKTDPGYDSNPGHAGTGTVVAQSC